MTVDVKSYKSYQFFKVNLLCACTCVVKLYRNAVKDCYCSLCNHFYKVIFYCCIQEYNRNVIFVHLYEIYSILDWGYMCNVYYMYHYIYMYIILHGKVDLRYVQALYYKSLACY